MERSSEISKSPGHQIPFLKNLSVIYQKNNTLPSKIISNLTKMILSKPIDFTTEEKLKNLNAQFLEAKDKHLRELDSSFEPMMEGFLRGFVESIPEIAGFLTRVCLGVLLQGGGNSHHGPPHF